MNLACYAGAYKWNIAFVHLTSSMHARLHTHTWNITYLLVHKRNKNFSILSPIYFINKLFSGVTKYASKNTYSPTSEIIFFCSLIGLLDLEEKDNMILWNVCNCLPVDTA